MPHDPRDLEWQRRYQENDTPWDKGAAAPALVKFLRENRIAGRVLVPGCGRGHDVRALGERPGIDVVGLDLAPAAVELATCLATAAKAGPNVNFIAGDFFHLPKKLQRSFDWIVEHTCFCALEPAQRPDYVRGAATALRTEGKIFAIFYLNPETRDDEHTGPPFPVSREELSALFDPRFTVMQEWVPQETFPGRESRELVRLLQKK